MNGHQQARTLCLKRADSVEKSFLGDEQNFLGPLMCFASDDVRDHVVSHKNDHGPSYLRYGAWLR